MIKNLVTVYISNFVGAMIIDLLIFFSGQLNYSNGGLGAFTIKVALAKTTINPATAIISGILVLFPRVPCNRYGNRRNRCNR